ncbi:hypothetical protein [Allokutzneria oryzae]|uniref:Uncharacterized protein n=1 Tax=Allokutzneria oryzae TaxID=1378989 RepID=A0ABV5ZUP7_9PSEU
MTRLLLKLELAEPSLGQDHRLQAEEAGLQLKENLESWRINLRDWIEVGTRISLSQASVERFDAHDELQLWYSNQEGGHTLPLGSVMGPAIELSSAAVSRACWQSVLEKARIGERPPAEHLFLRDARVNLKKMDFRRSVLDSATATELALVGLIKREADGFPGAFGSVMVDFVRSSHGGIAGYLDFLKSLGVRLSGRIKSCVAGPRNLAIHTGDMLGREIALKALEVASEVVDLLHPRSSLLAQ